MSQQYDPHLDNNYRVRGDRIISERTHQSEQATEGAILLVALIVGVLNRAFPLPKPAKLVVGISLGVAGVAWYGDGNPLSVLDLSGGELSAVLAVAGIISVVGYFLATGCIVATAMWFAYRRAGFFSAAAVLAMSYGIAPGFRAIRHRISTGTWPGVEPGKSVVRRGVLIFAGSVIGGIFFLMITFLIVDWYSKRAEAASNVTTASPGRGVPATPAQRTTASVALLPVTNESTAAAPPTLSGADTVRAFYQALGRGDGAAANSLMTLEKRAAPAFQPDAIEAFYGHMSEPLTLESVSAVGPTEFEARYTYRKASARCTGHSVVTVEPAEGRNLIAHIKPIGNC